MCRSQPEEASHHTHKHGSACATTASQSSVGSPHKGVHTHCDPCPVAPFPCSPVPHMLPHTPCPGTTQAASRAGHGAGAPRGGSRERRGCSFAGQGCRRAGGCSAWDTQAAPQRCRQGKHKRAGPRGRLRRGRAGQGRAERAHDSVTGRCPLPSPSPGHGSSRSPAAARATRARPQCSICHVYGGAES